MEPWFLYGIEMSQERRKAVFKLHAERGADGKPANPGWPNYVRGVLSEEDATCTSSRLIYTVYRFIYILQYIHTSYDIAIQCKQCNE